MQFTFGDKRKIYLLDKSALFVTEKEIMREGKRSIGPRIKYGHANHDVTRQSICRGAK